MEASAGTSASTSLIEQIRIENQRAAAERRALARRRRRRTIIAGVAVAAGLVVLAVVVRRSAVRNRIENRLDVAQAALAADRPAELQRAAEVLASNLADAPSHDGSLGLLALVRVHQFSEGWATQAEAEAAIEDAAAANSPEASLARGMLAALQGDFDEARRSYEAHGASIGTTEAAMRNDTAWLRGIASLGRPYDKDVLEGAAAAVGVALNEDPEWTPNRRVAIALAFRTGHIEEALKLVGAGREIDPAHLGLAADEVLLHGILGKELEGVKRAGEALLERPELSIHERTYVHLALAYARFRDGAYDDADQHLEAAWSDLPVWDNHARDIAIDVALTHGRLELVDAWLKDLKLDAESDTIYDAWRSLAQGDTRTALKSLAGATQELPRVAHLQALALVDQQRWEEAESWLRYAAPTLGHRLDLKVARAQVALQRGDATQAREELEALAEMDPHAPRIWNALAQARQTDEDSAEFEDAVAEAIEREPLPAEAYWLKGRRLTLRSSEDPTQVEEALRAYEKAVEANGYEPRYRAALGLQLAFMGFLPRAKEELGKALDPEAGINDGEALLGLAKILIVEALDARSPVAPEVPSLLARAAASQVDPWWVEIEWSRYELAQATQQSIASARLRTSGVLQQMAKNIEAREIQGDAMLAQGDFDAARDTLNEGIRKTLRKVDGPLYLGLARVELAAGNKRNAASQAFKGWRKLFNEPGRPEVLLRSAPFVARLWSELDNPRGARTVARELTMLVPYHVDAWILRAETEFADNQDEKGCEAALKAVELAPEHPAAVGLEGDCRVKQRNFNAARELYAKAADLAQGTPLERDLQKKRRRL